MQISKTVFIFKYFLNFKKNYMPIHNDYRKNIYYFLKIINSLSFPFSLFTLIIKLFLSAKSLTMNRPRPLPLSSSIFLASSSLKNLSKILSKFSFLIPRPKSLIDIFFSLNSISIFPFCFENLMALCRRLKMIFRISSLFKIHSIFSSPFKSISIFFFFQKDSNFSIIFSISFFKFRFSF